MRALSRKTNLRLFELIQVAAPNEELMPSQPGDLKSEISSNLEEENSIVRRTLIAALTTIAAVAITASVAFAAITFHSGPTVTFSGASATATFNVSGLGNDPAQADLSVSGSVTFACANHGGNQAPGHPQTLPAGGTTSAPLTKSQKNGRSDVTVTATLETPTPPTTEDLGCPNANWKVVVVSESTISATLSIEQPIGNTIYGPTTFYAP